MRHWVYRTFLFLTLLESCIAAYFQYDHLRLVQDQKSIFQIINRTWLVLIGVVIGGFIIAIILEFRTPSQNSWLRRIQKKESLFWGALIVCLLIAIESGQNLMFLRFDLPKDYFPFFLSDNLLIFQWAFVVSIQSVLVLLVNYAQQHKSKIIIEMTWERFLWGLSILGILLFLILTGSGFFPKSSQVASIVGIFLPTNAPLTMLQIIIIWLGFTAIWMLIINIIKRLSRPVSDHLRNIAAFLILWMAAFFVWSNVPISSNYHLDVPRAPNYQFNVTSDSLYYDVQAHRFLAGEKFVEDVQHPLYGFILSGLHVIGGDHYQDIYVYQIAIVALIPYLLYKLLSLMYSRYAGWLFGLLFIVREYNSLILGDSITVSNVQLLMTESVTLLGVILVVYLLMLWISEPEKKPEQPILIGILIGLLALIRIELLSLALVFGSVSLIIYWRRWWKWLFSSGLMLVALLLMTLPWMTRNLMETGYFSLDKGRFFQATIQSYKSQIFPSKGDIQRVHELPPIDDPEAFPGGLEKVWLHVKNSLSETLLYLPSSHSPFAGVDNYLIFNPDNQILKGKAGLMFSDDYLTGYIKSVPYWDLAWDGRIEVYSLLPITLVLILISIGFRAAWRKKWIMALTPVLVMIYHILIYAFFSRSGSRFVMLVDWVTLLFFTIGISCITQIIWDRIYQKDGSAINHDLVLDQNEPPSQPNWSRRYTLGLGGLILIIGISMPVIERLIPQRYTQEKLILRIDEIPSEKEYFEKLVNSDVAILYGKALYPGYFEEGEDLLDDRGGRIPDSDEARVMFYLVGMENIWVSLPMNKAPDFFPHGSEIILVGNITRDSNKDIELKLHPYFLADEVIILDEETDSSHHLHADP